MDPVLITQKCGGINSIKANIFNFVLNYNYVTFHISFLIMSVTSCKGILLLIHLQYIFIAKGENTPLPSLIALEELISLAKNCFQYHHYITFHLKRFPEYNDRFLPSLMVSQLPGHISVGQHYKKYQVELASECTLWNLTLTPTGFMPLPLCPQLTPDLKHVKDTTLKRVTQICPHYIPGKTINNQEYLTFLFPLYIQSQMWLSLGTAIFYCPYSLVGQHSPTVQVSKFMPNKIIFLKSI